MNVFIIFVIALLVLIVSDFISPSKQPTCTGIKIGIMIAWLVGIPLIFWTAHLGMSWWRFSVLTVLLFVRGFSEELHIGRKAKIIP
jgi:hypothetical protein